MNFQTAIRTINNDLCMLFYAKYLKGQWGISVGYPTVPEYIALMRKDLADIQEASDCSNALCITSKKVPSDTILLQSATLAESCTCVLNPPLSPYGDENWKGHRINVNEILINTFTRI